MWLTKMNTLGGYQNDLKLNQTQNVLKKKFFCAFIHKGTFLVEAFSNKSKAEVIPETLWTDSSVGEKHACSGCSSSPGGLGVILFSSN